MYICSSERCNGTTWPRNIGQHVFPTFIATGLGSRVVSGCHRAMAPLGGPGAPEGRSMATARRITRSCRAFGFRHPSSPRMLCVSSACILVFGIFGYHGNRMLLMMHLKTRLVTAPLSVWGAMFMRPQPRTNVCVPIRKMSDPVETKNQPTSWSGAADYPASNTEGERPHGRPRTTQSRSEASSHDAVFQRTVCLQAYWVEPSSNVTK